MRLLTDITDEDVARPEVRDRLRNELVLLITQSQQSITEAPDCELDVTQDEHLAHDCTLYHQRRLRSAVTTLQWLEHSAPERQGYRERTLLLALALLMPGADQVVHSAVIAYNDPQLPGWPVLYVRHMYGDLCWHVNPLDMILFSQLPVVEQMDVRASSFGLTRDEELDQLTLLCGYLRGLPMRA